jgi:hypothetical protein
LFVCLFFVFVAHCAESKLPLGSPESARSGIFPPHFVDA